MKLNKTQTRNLAKEHGERHFSHTCKTHGENSLHYVSSGRCMKCTAESKDPAKQAEYWKIWSARNK